ncbi:hypothetical protein Barb6_00759 [Bacteroidales bacterium Barb6]|nr:hypothetical protein Barb6_00759 [Bacteroidales bacterium Barb6]
MTCSYDSSNTNGGVAYANAGSDSSHTNTNIGSRLTFFFMAILHGMRADKYCREGRCALPPGEKQQMKKRVVGLFSKHAVSESGY